MKKKGLTFCKMKQRCADTLLRFKSHIGVYDQ